MSREGSELQQHQGTNVPLGGIARPGGVVLSQSSSGTNTIQYVWYFQQKPGQFREMHHHLCPSDPNVVGFKLALVEWKPWQAQEVLPKGKCPWRV